MTKSLAPCLAAILLICPALAAAAQDDDPLVLRITQLLKRVKANPDDQSANLEVGKLLCFERGQWHPGLFYLAQGNDKELRILAQRDLARPETTDEQVEIGDAWWDLGKNQKPHVQRHLHLRAVHWYRQALPQTSGLRRGRLESRIQMMPAAK